MIAKIGCSVKNREVEGSVYGLLPSVHIHTSYMLVNAGTVSRKLCKKTGNTDHLWGGELYV